MKNINYTLIYETAKDICEYYDINIDSLEEWEVCELVDNFIDEQLFKNKN